VRNIEKLEVYFRSLVPGSDPGELLRSVRLSAARWSACSTNSSTTSAIDAKFEKGVLTIRVPKPAEA
jgi:hypothetical protein